MPELPDIAAYLSAIEERAGGATLTRVRLASPFVLRTAIPPIREAEGKRLLRLERLGKRIILCLEGDLFLVIHLMVAGRFRWLEAGAKIPGKLGLLALDFETGSLILTEASTKKRASLHLVAGRAQLADFDRGGLELSGSTLETFRAAMTRERHTLKRALTDPTILSGVGNAYSDEILHAARLSPMKMTSSLSDEEWARLYDTTLSVLETWTARLRAEAGSKFPENVTAFRAEMAVHGRYGKPCPRCGAPVQRITYADNETNYCPTCQTGGKLLADRSLSRLLGADWPKTLEELEEKRPAAKLKPNPERSTRTPKKAPRKSQ
ncbi:MAG: formamidopyrimidine-DNA glycosylase [Myxococcales bacterium]|nr:formamidopyrimidine-DNA glycosylase [Myxococcales bacterium]